MLLLPSVQPAPYLDRSRDVLDFVFAAVFPHNIKTVTDLPVRIIRHADAVWFRQGFDTCRNVHAVAKDIVAFDDNVADVHANAEANSLVVRYTFVALDNTLLCGDGALDSGDDGRELKQQPIAHGLDDAAAMLVDQRIDKFGSMRAKSGKGGSFVRPHEARITDDIGGHDCRQSTLGSVRHAGSLPAGIWGIHTQRLGWSNAWNWLRVLKKSRGSEFLKQ
jgi:hypothetical protein